ncbi:MAG: cytochrome c [Roseibium sp.]|uniref:c-type cytochrome n=1 Tax=Roseibium sp. TaxID=1936156 RepID=UPI002615CEFD|nr:cytochrome c [Roseibium sp.]MCV0426475.1 cytochrome c [Roseibium sp.]
MPTKQISFLLLSLVFWPIAVEAQDIDPHALYERTCAGCHAAHAGEFVFETLEIRENSLVGSRSRQPVATFLETGHGGMSPAEVEVMVELLSKISQSGRLFFRKCRICHDSANDLARLKLVIRDGNLVGRYTGRDIAQFLKNHGRLDRDEIKTMLEVLEGQLVTKSEAAN